MHAPARAERMREELVWLDKSWNRVDEDEATLLIILEYGPNLFRETFVELDAHE